MKVPKAGLYFFLLAMVRPRRPVVQVCCWKGKKKSEKDEINFHPFYSSVSRCTHSTDSQLPVMSDTSVCSDLL